MSHSIANFFSRALPPLTSGQKEIFALGAGIFGYQIIAKAIHKFAQERFEKWHIHPTVVTGVLTLCWIGFIASSSSSLLVYFCFVATGVMAFAIYRSPLALGSPPPSGLLPPPSGLLDMVAQAQFHPEWEYCLPNEILIPLLETALKHPDKQSIMLLGDSGTGKTLQIEHLAWLLKFKKLPKGSPLEKIRIFKWDKYNPPQKLEEVLRFFKENPHACLFIDKNYKFTQKDGYLSSSDFEDNELISSAMQRRELRLIGTATPEEYTKRFAPTDTLNRLWHQLPINEPARELCAKILEKKLPLLTREYGIFNITKDALLAAAALSKMIWPKLRHPDSAFDLLNRVCRYAVTNPPTNSSSIVTIDTQEILQGAKQAQLIENDFGHNQLQLILNPPKQLSTSSTTQELLPMGLTDMVAEVESHPEWAYGANADELLPKIVTAQAESWRQSVLILGHATNITLLIKNLAWKIKNKKIPQVANLENLRIVKLNPNQLTDDGSYGSDKGKGVKSIIEYLAGRPNTICIIEDSSFFIEETSYASNKDRGAISAMREALSEGKLRLIGTISSLTKTIKPESIKNWILHDVPELTLFQCSELLMQAKEDIARRYSGINIEEEAIKAAIILAESYKPKYESLWESAYGLICQGCTQDLLSKNTNNLLTKEDIIKVVFQQKMSKDSQEKVEGLVNKKLSSGLLDIDPDEDGVL